jgi:hypothetical protein
MDNKSKLLYMPCSQKVRLSNSRRDHINLADRVLLLCRRGMSTTWFLLQLHGIWCAISSRQVVKILITIYIVCPYFVYTLYYYNYSSSCANVPSSYSYCFIKSLYSLFSTIKLFPILFIVFPFLFLEPLLASRAP